MSSSRGLLMVVSAPSGTGKTTVVERLIGACSGLVQSRSYTSRPARPGEADGVDYNFVERPAFEAMAAAGGFLEWADVFGNLYGTGLADTESLLSNGLDVVLVIDVQGARQVRRKMREAVAIFMLPPSFQVLEDRLRGRCQDAEPAIRRRLATAQAEITAVSEYDYVVVNDDLNRAVDELCAIVRAERARRPRRLPDLAGVVATFQGQKQGATE